MANETSFADPADKKEKPRAIHHPCLPLRGRFWYDGDDRSERRDVLADCSG
jgi:hypothetical protein